MLLLSAAQICLFNLQFTSKSAWFLKCVNSRREQLRLGRAHKEISFLISDSLLLVFECSDCPSFFLLRPCRSRTNSISPSADEWKSVSSHGDTRKLKAVGPHVQRPNGRIRQHRGAPEICDFKMGFFFFLENVWKKSSCSGALGEGCRADVELNHHSHSYSPKESPVSPNLYLWTVGGRQRTWAEPIKTVGDHANSTQKRP